MQIILSFCKHHLWGLTRYCFGSRQHQQWHSTDSKLNSQIRIWWCWHSHQEVFSMKNDSTKDKDKKNNFTLDRWIHYMIPPSIICTYLMELNTTMISMYTMVNWTKGPLLSHLTLMKLVKLVVEMPPIKHCFNGQVQLYLWGLTSCCFGEKVGSHKECSGGFQSSTQSPPSRLKLGPFEH